MRLLRSWRVASILSLSGLVIAIAAIHVSAQIQGAGKTVADPGCQDCGLLQMIPTDASPEVVAQKMEEAKAIGLARIQPELNRLRKESADRFNSWYGTEAFVDSSADDERDLCQTIAAYLTGDTTVPAGRASEFARFLNRGTIRCIRWDVAVLSAKIDGDSWEATVRVRPWLAKESGRPVYTPHATLETWRIEKDGKATPLKVAVDVSQPRGMIFED